MNDVNIPNKDLQNPEMQLDGNSEKADQAARLHSASRVIYPLQTASNSSVNRSLFAPHKGREVREDKSVYIPDPLPDAENNANPRPYTAIADHAKHLQKAEGSLDDASNIVQLMLAALEDESDGRAMQTIAGLKVIEEKLSKAHGQIDRHRTRHTNLFLAYFGLKNKMDGKE